MKKSYFCLAVLLCSLSFSSQARESSNTWCRPIKSSNELLKCTLASHPDIQVREASVEEEKKGIDLAGQRPNPGFDLEGVGNDSGGITSELSLMHTFELGGKRDSRIRIAKAQVNMSKSELLKSQEIVAIQTVLNIYRLRQIETELEATRESLGTFRGIRKKYQRIGRLNPEQQVSVSVFKLAEEDSKLKVNSLISEKEQILSTFRMIIGEDFKITKGLLPPPRKTWPSISIDKIGGADSLIALNSLAIAEAESDLAESEGWPDLSLGPKIEVTTGQNSETRIGIALSAPLPFYNTNNGGRAKAKFGVKKTLLNEEWTKRKLERKAKYLLADYKRSSAAVSRSIKDSNIASKHDELHKLIQRGVVSAPLVIEMHREIFEFYENLHAQESRALKNLWILYSIRGSILEENLK